GPSGKGRRRSTTEEGNMSPAASQTSTAIGLLTVLREAGGFVGGYLVTNGWGRPLEFRLTSAVQPNRVQQILYGGTLESYICADLIGKTLVDKAAVPVQLVVTDRAEVLDLRLKLDAPVAWLVPADAAAGRGAVRCHPRFDADAAAVRGLLDRLDVTFDL